MDYKKNIVSVITPGYNCEQYVHRLFDSLLSQTYTNLQIIFVNDGSTDNTESIALSYQQKFQNIGIEFQYHYQANSGQSGAVNYALKHINGEYLIWPDSDDFYADKRSIEIMVNALKNTDCDVSMVRTFVNLLDQDSLKEIKKIDTLDINKTDLFTDCLFCQNGYWFGAGVYMAKTAILFEKLIDKSIFVEKNAGQNWQLMLPLLYDKKCLTIGQYLYNILVRKDSHSRGTYQTYDQVKAKYMAYENTLVSTLQTMDYIENQTDLIRVIRKKYALILHNTAINFKQYKEAKKIREYINTNYLVLLSSNEKCEFCFQKNGFLRLFLKGYQVFTRIIHTLLGRLKR